MQAQDGHARGRRLECARGFGHLQGNCDASYLRTASVFWNTSGPRRRCRRAFSDDVVSTGRLHGRLRGTLVGVVLVRPSLAARAWLPADLWSHLFSRALDPSRPASPRRDLRRSVIGPGMGASSASMTTPWSDGRRRIHGPCSASATEALTCGCTARGPSPPLPRGTARQTTEEQAGRRPALSHRTRCRLARASLSRRSRRVARAVQPLDLA